MFTMICILQVYFLCKLDFIELFQKMVSKRQDSNLLPIKGKQL
jgi:hypothetical protein